LHQYKACHSHQHFRRDMASEKGTGQFTRAASVQVQKGCLPHVSGMCTRWQLVTADDIIVKYNPESLRLPVCLALSLCKRLCHPSKLCMMLPYFCVLATSVALATINCEQKALTAIQPLNVKGNFTNGTFSLRAIPNVTNGSYDCEDVAFDHLAKKLDSIVGYVLAGYVILSLGRWWAMRTNGVGLVMDACRNITRLLSTLCRQTQNPEEVRQSITQIYWLALGSLLCMSSVTHKHPAKELPMQEALFLAELKNLEEGRDKALAPQVQSQQDDLDLLFKDRSLDHAQIAWAEISDHARRLMLKEGVENDSCCALVYEQIEQACKGIATQASYLQTQLPFRYVLIIHCMVNIDTAVFAYNEGPRLRRACTNFWTNASWTNGRLDLWSDMIEVAVSLVVVPLIYNGILGLCLQLADPMGGDRHDFALKKAFIEPTAAFCESLVERFYPNHEKRSQTAA